MKYFKQLCILLPAVGTAWATFTVPWRTSDGGGGVSAAAIGASTWKVTGSTGQWDAHFGPGTNANGFSLSGGYWAIAIPTEDGGPVLGITVSGTHALVSWGASAAGYILQISNDLINWTDQPGTITGAYSLNFPLTSGPRYFFRLKLP